jgi:polysaccharide deacetylase family sporulation protein PdaB
MRIWAVPYRWWRRIAVLGIVAGVLAGMVWAMSTTPARGAMFAALPPQDRYALRDVITHKKVAALTFDISWGTVMPEKVLAILQRQRVPATFFVSGPWAEQHAGLVRQMADDGYQIESHGWAHVNFTGLSNPQIQQNLLKANAVIERITGKRPTFVRPPNGDFSPRTILASRAVGYTTVTWGTDSLDWMNPGVPTIIRRVTTRIHPGDIILMHASDTCKQTDIALPTILQDLKAKGYKLVTLKQLLTYGKPIYRG